MIFCIVNFEEEKHYAHWQEEQKKSYLEFLYDRAPLLPQQLQRKGYLDESVTALFYHLTEE